MTRTFLKLTIGTVLTSLMIAGGMQTVVSAQSEQAPERSLVGVWRVALTPRNCITGDPLPGPGAPYRGIYTFHEGGTMSEWLTNTFVLPTLRGPGHGVWQKASGWQNYTYTIIFNRYDATGIITGTQRGRARLVLGESGNDYTTTGTVQIFDVDDNPLGGMSCSTIEGTRFE